LFNDNEIDQAPDKIGIYAIHDRRGYTTYVGQGKIKSRLRLHKQSIHFVSDKVANSFRYFITQDGDNYGDAKQQAIFLEKLIIKFTGNSILLNTNLIEDLSRD